MSPVIGSPIVKDPESIEPFGFDWTAWLAELAPGTLIASSTWELLPDDGVLVLTSPSIVIGSLRTQAVFSGGTIGVRYAVTNQVVTTTGYQDERTFILLVKDK